MGWGITKQLREKQLRTCFEPKASYSFKVTPPKLAAAAARCAPTMAAAVQSTLVLAAFKAKQPAACEGNAAATEARLSTNATLACSRPKAKQRHTWPSSAHVAVLDAAAAIRRHAFKGSSALRVCMGVINLGTTSKPTELQIFFDRLQRAAYPPQRAELHRQRYAGKELSYDATADILERLNCTLEGLATLPILRPLLLRVDLDWVDMFMNKDLKAFAFRMFAVGFKHAAMSMFADGKLDSGMTIKVMSPATDHVCTLTKNRVSSTTDAAATPLRHSFGEGDLRCYAAALKTAVRDKRPVVIHSIDTDFLLMTFCTSAWLDDPASLPEVYIVLTSDVYVSSMLHRQFRPIVMEDRLNTAFWAMAFGTDYSRPLTNNGYYNAGLQTLLDPRVHGRQPITVLDSTTAVFKYDRAMGVLSKLRCHKTKKEPPDSTKTTLLKMMFCLEYYGLMFAHTPTSLYPETPRLDTVTLTYTFTYRPNTDVLLS
jgi:hypothetical protein